MDYSALLALYSKRDKIERAYELVQAIWNDLQPALPTIKAAYPELVDIGKELLAVVAPHLQASLASEAPLVAFGVKDLQTALNKIRGEKLAVNGDYDDATKAAVKRYQLDKGLAVDGWVGIDTMSNIMADMSTLKKVVK